MTEKRYYYDRALDKIKNRETGDDYWFLCDIVDLLNEQEERIHDKEELIRAKNQQLDDVKQILTYHKKVISYMEVGKCTNARLELILQILYELGWD